MQFLTFFFYLRLEKENETLRNENFKARDQISDMKAQIRRLESELDAYGEKIELQEEQIQKHNSLASTPNCLTPRDGQFPNPRKFSGAADDYASAASSAFMHLNNNRMNDISHLDFSHGYEEISLRLNREAHAKDDQNHNDVLNRLLDMNN